jgi:hypothetical protein
VQAFESAAVPPVGARLAASDVSLRSHAVPILQLFAVTIMVIPANTVIQAIGGQGYAAGIVGLFAFAAFIAALVLGVHNPLQHRHPVRTVLLLVWISGLLSYIAMDRAALTVTEVTGGDRWLLQLAVLTGIALIAAEYLTSLGDIRRVLRALVWGGAFCGVVAALQFWMRLDITPYLREIPGFSLNTDLTGQARGALNRAPGTSLTPIELGVVAGMLLPLATCLAIYDTDRSLAMRWAPVLLIGLGVPTAVSRSGTVAFIVASAMFIVLMPERQRLVGLCLTPIALAGVFMSAPGVIGTLTGYFQVGSSDDSVKARLVDYPVVERLVQQAPWFGHGGGTYIPVDTTYILDNQYLHTAVELGLVGLVVLVLFFVVPLISALVARRRTDDPELRLLCAALASALLAAAVCSFFFDSLSFPMFSGVYALVMGLVGACWRLTAGPTPQQGG